MLDKLLDPNVPQEALLNPKPTDAYLAEASAQPSSTRTASMLELHHKNGNRHAIPYIHLLWIAFDPSIGVKLHFATHTIRVRGRNLKPVYEQLVAQTCSVLREVDISEDTGDADATLITDLRFRPIRRGRETPRPSDQQDRSRSHDKPKGQARRDNGSPTSR